MKEKSLYDTRDGWGPCCSDCEWKNQAMKPCDVCAPLRRGDTSVLEKFRKENASQQTGK